MPSRSARNTRPRTSFAHDAFLASQFLPGWSSSSLTELAWEHDDQIQDAEYAVSNITAAMNRPWSLTAFRSETQGPADPSVVGRMLRSSLWRGSLPSQLQHARAEMEAYRELEDGWDGVGSVKPQSVTIDSALKFLNALPFSSPPPEATVAADGSVGWFWDAPEKCISVTFPDGERFVYYGKVGAVVVRGAGPFNHDAIPQDLIDAVTSG